MDLENGVRYASGDREIRVKAENCGNTVTDFQLEAFIQNAEPDLVAIEDFSGVDPIWTDDENLNGSRLAASERWHIQQPRLLAGPPQ